MKAQDYPTEMNTVIGCFVNGGKREYVYVCVAYRDECSAESQKYENAEEKGNNLSSGLLG